ncbi:FAXDC2 isoform 8 [Pan troglodytes]|uniref:Fatty acid hydroxylase domain containing 2 n=3 Tax=Hominidae TaxID=9604 RepID=E5RJN8_HUMAN|nr:FAXDC2 isoform 8 [Pan troglodytes]PNJ77656.1 FAXDC2 isoform 8 [Pongo abelii]
MRRTAFILGSGLLSFVAFWNSVTWCHPSALSLLLELQWASIGG